VLMVDPIGSKVLCLAPCPLWYNATISCTGAARDRRDACITGLANDTWAPVASNGWSLFSSMLLDFPDLTSHGTRIPTGDPFK
jgi:hypothetical protein